MRSSMRNLTIAKASWVTFLFPLILGTCRAQTVPATMPPSVPNLMAPAQQQEPHTGARPSSQIPVAQTQLPAPYPGTIEGFVYWDTTSFSHNPPQTCNGLTVTVLTGSQPGSSQLGTAGVNNFKYVGQVGNFAVCTYAFNKVPTGQNLQVQVGVATPSGFSPAPPAPAPINSVNIINGQCANLWSLSPSSVSDLARHWWTCNNFAYNVNFVLQGSRMMSPTPVTLLPASAQITGSGQTNSGPLLSGNSASSGGLLSGNAVHTVAPVAAVPPPTSLPPPSGVTNRNLGTTRVTTRLPVKLSPPKQGPKITNPKTSGSNSAIIAVLEKQKQAAVAEATQMKLKMPSTGTQVGTQVGPMQTMSATGGTPRVPSVAASAPSAVAAVNSSSTNSNSLISKVGLAPSESIALVCTQDPTMRVITVSGGPGPAIFTQDSNYNFYTITGCSFGEMGTNSKIYIYYQGTFREDFKIQQWSDNWIKFSLDPNLKGVDDQNNLTLVVQREDGTEAAKNGYQFYAARDKVLLPKVPRQYFSLDQFRPDNAITNTWTPTYTSASSGSVAPNMAGLTAEVHWDLSTGQNGAVLGGDDLYDFSKLHSTFALDSASLQWSDLSCTDPNYNQYLTSKTNWDIDWNGNSGIKVTWQGEQCNNTPGSCGGGGGLFSTDCFENPPVSNYGVDVWVVGPRGLDPWTGNPAS
jgi:hypothetical protein